MKSAESHPHTADRACATAPARGRRPRTRAQRLRSLVVAAEQVGAEGDWRRAFRVLAESVCVEADAMEGARTRRETEKPAGRPGPVTDHPAPAPIPEPPAPVALPAPAPERRTPPAEAEPQGVSTRPPSTATADTSAAPEEAAHSSNRMKPGRPAARHAATDAAPTVHHPSLRVADRRYRGRHREPGKSPWRAAIFAAAVLIAFALWLLTGCARQEVAAISMTPIRAIRTLSVTGQNPQFFPKVLRLSARREIIAVAAHTAGSAPPKL